jgi:hypothetical protein
MIVTEHRKLVPAHSSQPEVQVCIRNLGPYSQHFIFIVTYESAKQARVLHKTMLKNLAKSRNSKLLGFFISYDEDELL